MIYRSVAISTLIVVAMFFASCASSPTLGSISVTPGTASIGTVGGTAQFTATGTYVRSGHPSTTQNITSSVTWASSSTDVATVNSSGIATAVANGTTTITATMTSPTGGVVGSASLTVAVGGQGGARELTAITMIPASQTLNAIGASAQFIVIGTYSAAPTTENLAGQVTWASSAADVATINSSGLATAVACASSSCTTTITASATSLSGSTIIGAATLTVSPGSATQQRTLSAITIIPGAGTQTLETLGETAQFIAIGTYTASPITVDMTDTVTWASTDVDIATIDSSGLGTAVACGGSSCVTTITASAQAQDGSLIVGASNLTVNPGNGGTNLPSLSVYLVGAGTGTVASSPPGINCAGSGAGCTAYFPQGSSVTLTATPGGFGGWSANCTPDTASPCTVTMNTNQTVGAIFN
jgi:trimeric autotransporter adhesin